MSLKIKLAKKVNGTLQVVNPSTEADIVLYDENLSVKDALDALIETVDDMESKLFLNTVYMYDSDGALITDYSGTGAVAVASLAAAVIIPSDEETGESQSP